MNPQIGIVAAEHKKIIATAFLIVRTKKRGEFLASLID
jgi:hypothetical protein